MKSTIRRLSFSLIAASAVAFTPGIDPNRIVRQQSTHQSSTTTSSLSLSTSTYASDNLIPIALTREEGKNEKLLQALKKLNLPVLPVELPCIEHANGADYNQLADALHSGDWDYVAVTSPEAARVLASAWHTTKNAAQFPFAICAVGKATEQTLVDLGLAVVFTPSQAYAETLVDELPCNTSGGNKLKVLYPASTKATRALQDGLHKRGFHVTRLDTYDTITAQWSDEQKLQASNCRVVCFASPSSVKGWLHNTDNNHHVKAACIGKTSATACKKLGWQESNIFYPKEQPGIEGWISAIEEACESLMILKEQ